MVALTACQVLNAAAAASKSGECPGRDQRRPVFAGILPQPVRRRRWTRLHRVAFQVSLDVTGETIGRLVPPRPVLLDRFHHDPVQLAPHQLRQPRRLSLPLRCHRRQPLARFREPRARAWAALPRESA